MTQKRFCVMNWWIQHQYTISEQLTGFCWACALNRPWDVTNTSSTNWPITCSRHQVIWFKEKLLLFWWMGNLNWLVIVRQTVRHGSDGSEHPASPRPRHSAVPSLARSLRSDTHPQLGPTVVHYGWRHCRSTSHRLQQSGRYRPLSGRHGRETSCRWHGRTHIRLYYRTAIPPSKTRYFKHLNL